MFQPLIGIQFGKVSKSTPAQLDKLIVSYIDPQYPGDQYRKNEPAPKINNGDSVDAIIKVVQYWDYALEFCIAIINTMIGDQQNFPKYVVRQMKAIIQNPFVIGAQEFKQLNKLSETSGIAHANLLSLIVDYVNYMILIFIRQDKRNSIGRLNQGDFQNQVSQTVKKLNRVLNRDFTQKMATFENKQFWLSYFHQKLLSLSNLDQRIQKTVVKSNKDLGSQLKVRFDAIYTKYRASMYEANDLEARKLDNFEKSMHQEHNNVMSQLADIQRQVALTLHNQQQFSYALQKVNTTDRNQQQIYRQNQSNANQKMEKILRILQNSRMQMAHLQHVIDYTGIDMKNNKNFQLNGDQDKVDIGNLLETMGSDLSAVISQKITLQNLQESMRDIVKQIDQMPQDAFKKSEQNIQIEQQLQQTSKQLTNITIQAQIAQTVLQTVMADMMAIVSTTQGQTGNMVASNQSFVQKPDDSLRQDTSFNTIRGKQDASFQDSSFTTMTGKLDDESMFKTQNQPEPDIFKKKAAYKYQGNDQYDIIYAKQPQKKTKLNENTETYEQQNQLMDRGDIFARFK